MFATSSSPPSVNPKRNDTQAIVAIKRPVNRENGGRGTVEDLDATMGHALAKKLVADGRWSRLDQLNHLSIATIR